MKTTALKNVDQLYGLIGFPLSHSFSRKYFLEKFDREGIRNAHYELFPLDTMASLPELLATYPNLRGLNVTIPYKEAVLAFLDSVEEDASAIGAVNTIRISGNQLRGFNTDVYGFEESLKAFLTASGPPAGEWPEINALVLGTGGAAKAVKYVLQKMNMPHQLVSRNPGPGQLSYSDLDSEVMTQNRLIINTTPLGMAPNIGNFPYISYHYLSEKHLLFDLVYNPEKTVFLRKGAEQGCAIKNGLEMLYLQAEKAWGIWNKT